MLKILVCIFSVILVVQGVTEDGFTSSCDSNVTLFVQKRNVATFLVEDTRPPYHFFDVIRFYRGIHRRSSILTVRSFDPELRVSFYTDEDRFNVTVLNDTTLNITLQGVTVEDDGMYMLRQRSIICWELFVLDIWNPQGAQTFEEHRPAFIHATPPSSRMVRPRVNATSTWLVNGLNYSETTDFLKLDGQILIPSILRHLNDKNVTYRIVEDNGKIHEVQLTLSVTYGPDPYLQFSPEKTFYTLTSGELLADITCSTDCTPTCEITWDRSGVGNVLSLAHVDRSSSGMYTCQASRNGSDVTVERSIYVEVIGLYINGPNPYLQFSPAKTFYTLTNGELLADITCSTECNPTCEITWDRSGVGNVLSLGHVDRSSSGMYTCQASRNGSDVTVERSIYVEVTGVYIDNTAFIIAVAVLGTLLGMTMGCLGVCAVWIYRTSGKHEGKDNNSPRESRTHQQAYEQHISSVELEHYEDLNNPHSNVEEVYENTIIENVANPL